MGAGETDTGMEIASGPTGTGATSTMADTTAAIMGIIGMEIAITGREAAAHGKRATETGIGRRGKAGHRSYKLKMLNG